MTTDDDDDDDAGCVFLFFVFHIREEQFTILLYVLPPVDKRTLKPLMMMTTLDVCSCFLSLTNFHDP